MVTVERQSVTRGYIGAGRTGLVFAEGADVNYDLKLQPMALLKGRVAPGVEEISYHNPRSIYGDWRVTPGANGSFEVPVPTGDVMLLVGNVLVPVRGLKAQESRDLGAVK